MKCAWQRSRSIEAALCHTALPYSHTVWGEYLRSLALAWLWSAVWWLEAERCREDHQWLSPREMSGIGQFHMQGLAPGSEWRWAGSTQYPGFINHPAKAYRQTPSPPSPRQPLGLHRASEMSAQIWVLMQIIISIIFLHLCPRCQGNKAFPLSGSIRLQLVGILDSEPDGLAMLAAYVQQAVLCQARIRFLLIWSKQECIHIYLPDPTTPRQPAAPVLHIEKLTRLYWCLQQEKKISSSFLVDGFKQRKSNKIFIISNITFLMLLCIS